MRREDGSELQATFPPGERARERTDHLIFAVLRRAGARASVCARKEKAKSSASDADASVVKAVASLASHNSGVERRADVICRLIYR